MSKKYRHQRIISTLCDVIFFLEILYIQLGLRESIE